MTLRRTLLALVLSLTAVLGCAPSAHAADPLCVNYDSLGPCDRPTTTAAFVSSNGAFVWTRFHTQRRTFQYKAPVGIRVLSMNGGGNGIVAIKLMSCTAVDRQYDLHANPLILGRNGQGIINITANVDCFKLAFAGRNGTTNAQVRLVYHGN